MIRPSASVDVLRTALIAAVDTVVSYVTSKLYQKIAPSLVQLSANFMLCRRWGIIVVIEWPPVWHFGSFCRCWH